MACTVETWAPGVRVRVQTADQDVAGLFWLSVVGLIVGMILLLIGSGHDSSGVKEVGLSLAALGLCGVSCLGGKVRANPVRTVTLDWADRTLCIARAEGDTRLPFSAVKEVLLSRTHYLGGRYLPRGGGQVKSRSSVCLQVVFEERGVPHSQALLEESDRGAAEVEEFLSTRSRGKELAEALGVPYRFLGDHANA